MEEVYRIDLGSYGMSPVSVSLKLTNRNMEMEELTSRLGIRDSRIHLIFSALVCKGRKIRLIQEKDRMSCKRRGGFRAKQTSLG